MSEDLVLNEMMNLGFGRDRIALALRARGGDRDRAIEWLLQNPGARQLNPEHVATLQAFGFTQAQAEAALRVTTNLEMAANWIIEHPDAGSEFESPAPTQETERVDEASPLFDVNVCSEKGHILEEVSFTCPMCRMSGPDDLAGPSRCSACLLCAACCTAGMVDNCPSIANGGSWHQHALNYVRSDPGNGPQCSIRGQHCMRNASAWCCASGCGFAICPICIGRAPHQGFSRGGRRGHGPWGPQRNEGADGEGITQNIPTFNATVAERYAAGEWELRADSNVQPVEDVIMGAGAIESPEEAEARRAERLTRGGVAAGGVAFATMPPKLERMLSEKSRVALVTFASGSQAVARHTGTWLNDWESVGCSKCAHVKEESPNWIKEPHWTCCGACEVKADGCVERQDNDDKIERAAADITIAEQLLAQSSVANLGGAAKMELRAAVAAGDLAIAAQFLMAACFHATTDTTANTSASKAEVICPVCAEEVVGGTGLGGAVGCFNGHALHASCAADLALGGSVCPTCRSPMFFAQLEETENEAARRTAKEIDLGGASKPKGVEVEVEKKPHELAVGDCVRIHSDPERCANLQREHRCFGGWNRDMEPGCGAEGQITEIIDCEIDGEMFHPIEVCIYRTGDTWRLHPDLLTFVREAGTAQAQGGGPDLGMDSAEQLARLRAELAVVKHARERVQSEIAIALGVAGTSSEGLGAQLPLQRALTHGSAQAVGELGATVAPVDVHRARRLLALAKKWGNGVEACEARAALHAAVCAGDLDSVARAIRRRNAAATMQRLVWTDAASETGDYRIAPGVRLELRTRPQRIAKTTGFALSPGSKFTSTREVLDAKGNLWLRVGNVNSAASLVATHPTITDGALVCSVDVKRAAGMRVTRGPDWENDEEEEEDAEAYTEGILIGLADEDDWGPGYVRVRWASGRIGYHRAGTSHDLKYIGELPLTPPPAQGWLQVRPGGPGTPCIAARIHTALRCYDCGGDLLPPFAGRSKPGKGGSHRAAFTQVQSDTVEPGDKVLVAATLEYAIVVRILNGTGEDESATRDRTRCFVICRFPEEGIDERNDPGYDDDALFAFRPSDLVWPGLPQSGISPSVDAAGEEEVVLYKGALRTRRELVLMSGSVDAARACWAEAVGGNADQDNSAMTFASCVRGHLLHARCFQGLMVAGRNCPACSEPLYVPRIQRTRVAGEDTCGAHSDAGVAEALQAVGAHEDATQQAAAAAATAASESMDIGAQLKMCPMCYSGPLLNEHCSDLRAHHGQCPRCGAYPYTAAAIAEMMAKAASSHVGVKIPRCRSCDCAVYFNGCAQCGHLFADIDWEDLPKWDEKAKGRMELQQSHRHAARLLAAQVRQEAAFLSHERAALEEARTADLLETPRDKDPPPPPVFIPPMRRTCGPDCRRIHDGPCQLCGAPFDHHDGHRCEDGRRGTWLYDPEGDARAEERRRRWDEEEEE